MRIILLVVFSSFILSCSNNQKVPEGVIAQEKMEKVLWELLQTDAFINYKSSTDTLFKTTSAHIDLYKKVFQSHKVTKEEFEKSLQYYKSRPDLLKTIFDRMNEKASAVADSTNKDSLQAK